MKRKIIEIDEDLCNGCGDCVTDCAEGALQIINGKAKLIKDDFCDGLGACIGSCPTGALKIIEREAADFDEGQVEEHLKKTRPAKPMMGGCPGLQMKEFKRTAPVKESGDEIQPEIQQWPLMLHLLSPAAPYLKGKEFVLLSTCSPVASPNINRTHIRGRNIALACPKLDRTEPYVQKLVDILEHNQIPKLIVLRMEVPCCGGLAAMAHQAIQQANSETVLEIHTVALDGKILSEEKVN